MEKEFCTYDIALALKELGFNEPCFGKYTISVHIPNFNEDRTHKLDLEMWLNETFDDNKNELFPTEWCSAPTYQQAFRWFRDKHGIFAEPSRVSSVVNGPTTGFFYFISDDKEIDIETESSESYEEAELKCLFKLIELYKKHYDINHF